MALLFKKCILAALSAVLCLSSAATGTAVPGQKKARDVDFHCCSPKHWTATVRADSTTIKDGVITHNETWMKIHYDSDKQRMAYTNVTQDGHPPYFQRTIEDYLHHAWTIVVNKDLCVIYNLTGSFKPKCTPKNISMVLFAVAPVLSPQQGVFANTAYFSRHDVTGHVTVTVGDCALIEEVTYDFSRAGVSSVDNVQYFNQTLEVEDSVFDVPDNCIYVPPDDTSNHGNSPWVHRLPRHLRP